MAIDTTISRSRRALLSAGLGAVLLAGCGGNVTSPASPTGNGATSGVPASPSGASSGPSPRPAWLTDASNPAAGPGALEPGVPYYFDLPVSVTFSAPAGWSYQGTSQYASFIADAQQTAAFAWLVADNLFQDPCHWQKGELDPPVGPSVDALVMALEKLPSFRVARPTSVTIGGLPAQSLTLLQTIRGSACDGSQLKVWSWEPSGKELDLYGGTITVRVLSVDGTRLVVFSWTAPLDDAASSDVEAIERSIRFK